MEWIPKRFGTGPVLSMDLSGVDGLVHISELDWSWISHPSDIIAEGDDVDVLVKEVDLDRGRVSLSRKRLLPRPQVDKRRLP